MNLYKTWFGYTPEYQKRTWGLIFTTVMLSPFIAGLYVLEALGVPFTDKCKSLD